MPPEAQPQSTAASRHPEILYRLTLYNPRHGRKGKARGKGYAWWHVLFEQILVLIVLLLLHWQSLVRHGGSPGKLGVFMEGRLMHWQSLLRWINVRLQACLSISFHRFARW